MAIEIIKRRTKETITCVECGCYFSYEEEDTAAIVYDVINNKHKKVVKCPQCERSIILEATR